MIVDINECLSSPCGHTCTNTVGSFVCSCYDGYVLDSDGSSCNGYNGIIVLMHFQLIYKYRTPYCDDGKPHSTIH